MTLVPIEFLVLEQGPDVAWRLPRDGARCVVGARDEGVGAMVEHLLGKVVCVSNKPFPW